MLFIFILSPGCDFSWRFSSTDLICKSEESRIPFNLQVLDLLQTGLEDIKQLHALFSTRLLTQVTAAWAKLLERVCVQPSLESIFSRSVSFSLSPGMALASPVTLRPVQELRRQQICQSAVRVSCPPGATHWEALLASKIFLHVSTNNLFHVNVSLNFPKLCLQCWIDVRCLV